MTKTKETKNSKLNECQVVTGEVRLSYVNLFEARGFNEADEPKYSVTILIPKDTEDGKRTYNRIMTAIRKAAELGAAKHFGGRIPTEPVHTLRDGDTDKDDLGELKKEKSPELAGNWFMRLSTKFAPVVLRRNDVTKQLDEILNPMDVYSGMYGKVSLTTFAYSGDGRRGISAVLNNVLITKDGEPLVSRLTGNEFDEFED